MTHIKMPPKGRCLLQGQGVEGFRVKGGRNGGWWLTMKIIENCDGSESHVGDTFSVCYYQGALPYLKLHFSSVIKAKDYKIVRDFFDDFENLSFSTQIEHRKKPEWQIFCNVTRAELINM